MGVLTTPSASVFAMILASLLLKKKLDGVFVRGGSY